MKKIESSYTITPFFVVLFILHGAVVLWAQSSPPQPELLSPGASQEVSENGSPGVVSEKIMHNRSPDLSDSARLQLLIQANQRLQRVVAHSDSVDTLFVLFTDSSRAWLQQITQAAQYEGRNDLEKRPFYEMLTITGVRLLYRNYQMDRIDTTEVLRVLTGKYGILSRALAAKQLGPFWVEQKNGEYFGYRGSKSSPKVALFYYHWEDFEWRLSLTEMLPIVSRGLETIGIKQKWTPSQSVLEILKQGMDYYVDESLLEP